MNYVLTERELRGILGRDQPDLLRRGGIDVVVEVLDENYARHEDEKLRKIMAVEQDRQKNKEQELDSDIINRKSQKLLTKAKHTQPVRESKPPSSIPWMETQKPGFLPSPALRTTGATQDKEVVEDARPEHGEEQAGSIAEALENEIVAVQQQVDPDACLHLQLWMVRNPTELMREFLQTEHNRPLYLLGNGLVVRDIKTATGKSLPVEEILKTQVQNV
ncbi:hypothetical protein T265_14726 [Opisthorchis viverrini]|uniref:Uncharacterized protein n=1 Tax=Opisthorchis viverrini TaxID=6198 RepID=A0A074ZBP5_OPIVI|nr:hypothetical protein T265_14726 [Opisthorchis viverrini]KER23027.1 hypothetical protein T265_14726 [Opisthorchis viverrini]